MKEIAGRDLYITELSREHIRAYFEILKYLPHRVNTKELKNKKWKQLAELGRKGQVERLLSSKTLQSRQINVRSFVNWCELEYKGIIQARYINSGFQKVVADRQIARNKNKREGFPKMNSKNSLEISMPILRLLRVLQLGSGLL